MPDALPDEPAEVGGHAQRVPDLLRENAEVEPPRAVDLDPDDGRLELEQIDLVRVHLARVPVDLLPPAGEHIERGPLVLERGVHRRRLEPFPPEPGKHGLDGVLEKIDQHLLDLSLPRA